LLGASAASAKEPPQTTVCGRSVRLPTDRMCLRLNWRDRAARLLVGSVGQPFQMRSRPRPAPFYTVTVRFPDSRWDWWFLYVPTRGLIRQTTSVGIAGRGSRSVYWQTVPTNVQTAFDTLSKRLRPFPAPRRWR